MPKLRVMIVDDSVVVRKIVSDVLAGDADIEVVGTASNGRLALARLASLRPDLVTLDVEMPEMDGLATLRAIRTADRRLPVIMFSATTERGAAATLDALSAGANEYVTKPTAGSVAESMAAIREQLIPKIKSLCARAAMPAAARPMLATSPSPAPAARTTTTTPVSGGPIDVVAIGVSTGGPDALSNVLPLLPRDLPVAVLVTQHMPAIFTKLLADRLATRCALPVREAVHGEPILPGQVLIAPGDFHLTIARTGASRRVSLTQSPPENSCRPSVDVMFRSVADAYGGRTLGVVLTGMGSDGLKGCERLRAVGAQTIVQDEATSVVWGMPGFVARAGLADRILPLAEVAGEIVRRARVGRASPKIAA